VVHRGYIADIEAPHLSTANMHGEPSPSSFETPVAQQLCYDALLQEDSHLHDAILRQMKRNGSFVIEVTMTREQDEVE
jgi:hypothetical protein